MTIILSANNPEELKIKLAEMDINVPRRSNGRKTIQVERYCIAYFLATLPISSLLFPLTVSHGDDKPDFVLNMSTKKSELSIRKPFQKMSLVLNSALRNMSYMKAEKGI
jgi:hypothetical protein